MTKVNARSLSGNKPSPDVDLIRGCLDGSESAWSRLIDKYRNLIFSIPIRRGMPSEDAADIFQAVCVDLLSELPRLRHTEALPRWLIQVTYHKCLRWRSDRDRYLTNGMKIDETEPPDLAHQGPEDLLYESERSQRIREVLSGLEPRCRHLIEALFFESPARPYREVAQSLGLAPGSLGPVRERCLERVRKLLGKAEFE